MPKGTLGGRQLAVNEVSSSYDASGEDESLPQKEDYQSMHEQVVFSGASATCTEDSPVSNDEQVFVVNSTDSEDVKDTSVALHPNKANASGKISELHQGLGEVNPPPNLDSSSLELSASTLLVLADHAYDLFSSGILDQWIHPQCNQLVCTDIYLTLKYSSSKKQWLDFFQKQEIDTQRAIFHSPGMQSLLLTRAGRSEGVS